jgi:hypothetical protein
MAHRLENASKYERPYLELKENGKYDHHIAAFAVFNMHDRKKLKEDNLKKADSCHLSNPFARRNLYLMTKVKVQLTLQQAMQAHRGSRGIALIFL